MSIAVRSLLPCLSIAHLVINTGITHSQFYRNVETNFTHFCLLLGHLASVSIIPLSDSHSNGTHSRMLSDVSNQQRLGGLENQILLQMDPITAFSSCIRKDWMIITAHFVYVLPVKLTPRFNPVP